MQIIAQTQHSQTKKLNARNKKGIFPVATAQTKNDAQKPKTKPRKPNSNKKAAQKNPKATDGLEIFARAQRRITNARTQFNADNEPGPFAAAKTKKAQANPMVN